MLLPPHKSSSRKATQWWGYNRKGPTFLLMHTSQESLNGLFNNALRTSDIFLTFDEEYIHMGREMFKVLPPKAISGRRLLRKLPIKSSPCLSPQPDGTQFPHLALSINSQLSM